MHTSVLAALWLTVLYLLVRFINYVYVEITHSRRARKLHCKPPPRIRTGFPLGIKQLLASLRADREKRFPRYLVEQRQGIDSRVGRCVQTSQLQILGQRRILTHDPVNIKAILATQFKEFGLGHDRVNNFEPLLGHGIFSSDGKQWEMSRALLRPQFARAQISDLDQQEVHVQNLMRVLTPGANGWTEATDIQVLFFRLTIDSATEFLFGESLDSQISRLKNSSSTNGGRGQDEVLFAYSYDKALSYVAMGTRLGHFYRFAHTPGFRKATKEVHRFVDHYVQKALQQNTRDGSAQDKASYPESKGKYVFLDALAASTRDPVELRSQLLNILLAGRDTTASLLGWSFQLFIQHPEVYAKLRETVLDSFGTYTNPKNLSFSELKSCTYLQHCINESLRLYPVVPINFRRCLVSNTTLPRGGGPDGEDPVYVRANEEIVYSVHVMHRSKELWGEDANEFRPQRWEGRKTGWEYLPFNGGPRICIGQQFALTEASYVIVRLVQRFEELKGIGTPRIGMEKHNLRLTNCPAGGVRVSMKVADE